MPTPIVFISHFRIKEGALDGVRQLAGEVAKRLEEGKPRTLLFLNYLDEDGTHASFLHAFADASSMSAHVEGSDERARKAYEYLEPEGWEVYGTPGQADLDTLRGAAASAGVPLRVQPQYLAGFLRLASQGTELKG